MDLESPDGYSVFKLILRGFQRFSGALRWCSGVSGGSRDVAEFQGVQQGSKPLFIRF